jgi:hypothetical protein
MKRRIKGFEMDEHGDWRAELECGHFQHVRHGPPLMTRSWVLTEEGRPHALVLNSTANAVTKKPDRRASEQTVELRRLPTVA